LNVLVTGGCGFIGSHVAELLSREHSVYVLDNLSGGSVENLRGLNVELIRGDIRDGEVVDRAVSRVDAVVHLAAVVSVAYSVERPEEVNDVNVAGTLRLLKACSRRGVRRFVFASSCAVYGEPRRIPIDEDHPTAPLSPYAASKLAAEAYVHAYSAVSGLRYAILRIFNAYGPRQAHGEYGGVVARFICRALRGEPLVIYGDGRQTRDFIYVGDVAEAFRLALESGPANAVYNVGTGVETSIRDLASAVVRVLGASVGIEHAPPRPGDVRRSRASIKRISEDLGFRPRVTLEEGIRRTIPYYRSLSARIKP